MKLFTLLMLTALSIQSPLFAETGDVGGNGQGDGQGKGTDDVAGNGQGVVHGTELSGDVGGNAYELYAEAWRNVQSVIKSSDLVQGSHGTDVGLAKLARQVADLLLIVDLVPLKSLGSAIVQSDDPHRVAIHSTADRVIYLDGNRMVSLNSSEVIDAIAHHLVAMLGGADPSQVEKIAGLLGSSRYR